MREFDHIKINQHPWLNLEPVASLPPSPSFGTLLWHLLAVFQTSLDTLRLVGFKVLLLF